MSKMAWIIFAVAGLVGTAGCGQIERKITIATDPPGAVVYVNGVEKGRSPVTFPFLWYGDYDIRLRLERNEGTPEEPRMVQYYLHTHRQAKAPVYQWMGLDLFTELLPLHLTDAKIWAFDLPAASEPSDQALVESAKDLEGQLNTPTPLERPQPKK